MAKITPAWPRFVLASFPAIVRQQLCRDLIELILDHLPVSTDRRRSSSREVLEHHHFVLFLAETSADS